MDRYLIEVPHEEETVACARVVHTFLKTGSHYLTQADWGCKDGDHRALMIVEAADREEARFLVPPPLRSAAKVVRLCKFKLDAVQAILDQSG